MISKVRHWKDDKGYGFLYGIDGGDDIFIHCSQVLGPDRKLMMNEKVRFEIGPGKKPGSQQAVNVQRLGL